MILAVLLPLLLSAPDPGAILEAVRKAYTSSPSFTTDFVQTYAPAGFSAAAPETGRVTLQAPDRIRFDYDGPEGKLFTFDGKAARQYVAADRQMIVKTLSASDPSVEYAETRAFYARLGYTPLEEFPTLWGPGVPVLQLVKHLSPPGDPP